MSTSIKSLATLALVALATASFGQATWQSNGSSAPYTLMPNPYNDTKVVMNGTQGVTISGSAANSISLNLYSSNGPYAPTLRLHGEDQNGLGTKWDFEGGKDWFYFKNNATTLMRVNEDNDFMYLGRNFNIVGPTRDVNITGSFSVHEHADFQTTQTRGQATFDENALFKKDVTVKKSIIVQGTSTAGGQIQISDIYGAGGRNLVIGDDSYLSDVDHPHTLGVYSQTDATLGAIRLGSDAPTIFGNGGSLGIGTESPDASYTVDVAGALRACEIRVNDFGGWCDYVFADDYQLRPLSDVESFIKANRHLPEIPSEAVVLEEGISLGDMNARLLKKVEELTLYLIEQQKRIETLEQTVGKEANND